MGEAGLGRNEVQATRITWVHRSGWDWGRWRGVACATNRGLGRRRQSTFQSIFAPVLEWLRGEKI